MTAHKHAALMLQYAQDAMETAKPWERWELRPMGSAQWHACSGRISFNERCEYRRIDTTEHDLQHEYDKYRRAELMHSHGASERQSETMLKDRNHVE